MWNFKLDSQNLGKSFVLGHFLGGEGITNVFPTVDCWVNAAPFLFYYFIEVHCMNRLIGHSTETYLTAVRSFAPTACETI